MASLGTLVRRLAPLAVIFAAGGCFATRADIRVLQTDIGSLRTELLRNDAEMREALSQATRLLAVANDSLKALGARSVSMHGDVRGSARSIEQQLLQIQALLGQSQANLNRLRGEIEARNNSMVIPPVTPPAGAVPPVTDTTKKDSTVAAVPTERVIGPTELYNSGTDQLRRNSYATARSMFQELLQKFPTSDHAPGAQYYIGDSYHREKNLDAADAAYAAVVTKYPTSDRAPTALYKRAQIAADQGNSARARQFANEVIAKYARSVEAELAVEFIKNLK